jgi:hypothetical protein
MVPPSNMAQKTPDRAGMSARAIHTVIAMQRRNAAADTILGPKNGFRVETIRPGREWIMYVNGLYEEGR